jgi:hypothetical protein
MAGVYSNYPNETFQLIIQRSEVTTAYRAGGAVI